MYTYHIHITGQVQGVGFRPFVYKIALSMGIHGWVKNTIDGVHIRFNAEECLARDFYDKLINHAPALSIITDHSINRTEQEKFNHFDIVRSDAEGKSSVLLTTDFGICDDCRRELHDPSDRRNLYAFITCTNCGPRYSIITELPYDRPFTSMKSFSMCPDCQKEYYDPLNRRYFSQTNSCPNCRITMEVYVLKNGKYSKFPGLVDPHSQVEFVVEGLKEGKIIAIKGIGGFLLIADATNKKVIRELRERKHRPSKAFALMFPNKNQLLNQFILHKNALEVMEGPVSPIVLLKPKNDTAESLPLDQIAPGLDHIGVMLPYTPLYDLILKKFGKPIIATSGNLSNEPIIYNNLEALESFRNIADVVLLNDREILIPQDDSVWSFTERAMQKILLRRSRGMAPAFVDGKLSLPDSTILAVGAELKSSFSLFHNSIPFVSQYLGDLEDYATQTEFTKTVDHFLKIFKSIPEVILCDMHPGYYATHLAETLGRKFKVKVHKIQHHIAHFAAILGEHHLFGPDEKILGVVWDGTGFGQDGAIWGGEFFSYVSGEIQRIGHLDYFPLILGDKMPKEPRISALSFCSELELKEEMLKEKFSRTEWKIYEKILQESDPLMTSSMGRLFDAMASLILSIDKTSYEGEAAMLLEVAARKYFNAFAPDHFEWYRHAFINGKLDINGLIRIANQDKSQQVPAEKIAFKFHCTLVKWIELNAVRGGFVKIAFSGGVFQNGLLIDLIINQLKDEFELFFHEKLSPNDECISFGQCMFYLNFDLISIN